ncbi:hypothetical protein AVEN_193766-1 [Araneus ventricosus]|uniref:Tc1-like transposase DDE domain-containing protein n=1 Tax=Araneus ventricosus TaxID=182803 RepID=A0A4Y2DL02_ARAVE|nr:hypothetical protein AVEN_193766-1 [Araneus ventricosus]
MQNKERWNIFWTDEAYFHVHGHGNTRNCRIWAMENLSGHQPVPLHSEKVTVWCGFTASFIVGPSFFEEIGPVIFALNGVRYESLLSSYVIPALQQRACVRSTIFMQDGAPPHISNPVKRHLSMHFGNYRIISRHFLTNWSP